jgi:phosphate transport system substrate-binding protein
MTPGFLNGELSPLQVDGVRCTPAGIRSGNYPLARPLYLVTNGYPEYGSHLHRLVTLHLSRTMHEAIERLGYVPVTDY